MAIKEYKCSNCGGALAFDGKAGRLLCAHCGSGFDIAAFEAYKEDIEAAPKSSAGERASGAWWDDMDAGGGVETGECPSCGAELFACKNAVAVVCPHCGNAEIAVKRLSGILKPDYIIPFKLKKKSAIAALKRFCKDKYLLPSDYFHENRINGMQGVYVPFWLFDVKRGGAVAFEKIPVDGSRRMDDEYMDAIEPFYYGGMKVFDDPAYLAGYLADRYDVSSQECKERAKRRMEGTLGAAVTVKDAKESYALFPVWIFNAKYGGENYKFMVNGQTGSLAGRLPTDAAKVKKSMAALTAAYGILFTAIALVILRPSVVNLLLGGDRWGFEATQLLLTPLGHLVSLMMRVKIVIILALWYPAYMLALGILEKWKARMDTIGLKTEASDYVVRG